MTGPSLDVMAPAGAPDRSLRMARAAGVALACPGTISGAGGMILSVLALHARFPDPSGLILGLTCGAAGVVRLDLVGTVQHALEPAHFSVWFAAAATIRPAVRDVTGRGRA